MNTLGSGDCGSRTYQNVGANTIDAIIAGLTRGGATITGNNPWTVDTHKSDVVLRGTWDAAAKTLQVAVTDSAWYAPCGNVWGELEMQIMPIIAANQAPVTVPAVIPRDQLICFGNVTCSDGPYIGANPTITAVLVALQNELVRVTKSLGLAIAGNTAEWALRTGTIGTETRDAVNQVLAQTTNTVPAPQWQTTIATPWGVAGAATTLEVAQRAAELTRYLASARKITVEQPKSGMPTALKIALAIGLGIGAIVLIRRVSRSSATAPS